MKNKLEVNFVAGEKFVSELALDIVKQRRVSKTSTRRESVTPKIVVCPPTEEMSDQISAPRGARLLRAFNRRLRLRTADADSLESSGSSDSEQGRTDDRSSCSASDTGSDGSERRPRNRSSVSLCRMFQSLSLTSRSQSCSSTDRQRQPKKQAQPKRILRPPVTYTYVRGLSGLPTQRVPRRTVYCTSSGLHR